jgi:hypothetical protein
MLIKAFRQGEMRQLGTLAGGWWQKDFREGGNVKEFKSLGPCLGIDAELHRTLRAEPECVGGPLTGYWWRVKGGPHYRITVATVDALVAAGLAMHFHYTGDGSPAQDHGAQYMVPIKFWGVDGGPAPEDPWQAIQRKQSRREEEERAWNEKKAREALERAHGKKAAALELAGQETLF